MGAIENEILVTLIGAVVVVLITIIQMWAMSRAKYKHHHKMLALEHSLDTGNLPGKEDLPACSAKSPSLFCNLGHLLQIILGVVIFAVFSCWAVYLVSVGHLEWAPLPGSLALIALMTPIIAWRGFKHRHVAMNRLVHDIEFARKTGAQEPQQAVEPSAQPVVVESLAAESEAIVEPASVAPKPAAPPESISRAVGEPVAVSSKPVVIEKRKLPEDSILRRHFLTHLRSQIESLYPLRPTDSVLRRHFDHFIAAEMQKHIDSPIETPIANAPVAARIIEPVAARDIPSATLVEPQRPGPVISAKKPTLPQDSILRRHFLTQLRFDIEAALPRRPTDSILKRHYENLVATELAKRLEQMEA